jgi:hypothetical protein
MKNNTAGEAEVIISIKEDSIHSSPFYISNSKEVNFLVLPGKKGRINLSCGIGNWTPVAVKNLADDLESIKIRGNGTEIHLTSEEQITSYLLSKRTGIDKGTIDIRIEVP